jgi:nucleoid-associated protein YgaU
MQLGRYAAIAALLLMGACAALPFARPAPSLREEPAEIQSPAARLALPQIAVEANDPAPSPVPEAEVVPASWHEPTPIVLPADGAPLPALPHVPLARSLARDHASRIQEPDFSMPAPAPPPAVSRPAARKHRITDGDSLEVLALRYLGDKSRAGEIAALNRDIFSDPALLPIGREINIPEAVTNPQR